MDKKFTFLLLFILSLPMLAQNTDFYFEAKLNTLNTPFSVLDSTVYTFRLIQQIELSNTLIQESGSEKLDSILKQDDSGNLEKEVPEYDSNGIVVKYNFFQKIETDTAWTITNFSTINYDSLGNISTIANYKFENGNTDSIPNFQTVISYKSQDTISAINELVWNNDSAKWVQYWKSEMTYNTSNNDYYYLTYDFDNASQSWFLTDSVAFIDKGYYNIISFTYKDSNYIQKWNINYNSYESGYTITGTAETEEYFLIDGNASYLNNNQNQVALLNDYGFTTRGIIGTYEYDEAIDISELILPKLFFLNPLLSEKISQNKPLSLSFQLYDLDPISTITTTFNYAGGATAVKDITTEGLYVYPNPANEQVCFTWEDKKI